MAGELNLSVAIASTFTAEPVEASLRFWLLKLGLEPSIVVAPFNQVLRQFLEPSSLLRQNRGGVNVVLIRVEDWIRSGNRAAQPTDLLESHDRTKLREHAQEFARAVRSFATLEIAPLLVVFAFPSSVLSREALQFIEAIELATCEELRAIPGVYPILSAELSRLYPTERFYDLEADARGSVPYSPEAYAALGTLIARRIRLIRHPEVKVVVVDADQTLWGGVVAEEGASGIRLEPGHLALQRALLQQQEAGRVLCLCSKNNEADVWEVFATRPDMVLKREHFVASRINWKPKSANLRELARELSLDLSSFLFLDDNPAECAEVRSGCPGVVTVPVPSDSAELLTFAEHLWPFDILRVTDEDRRRTAMYRENLRRGELQRASGSLEEFIAGLRLEVSIQPITSEAFPRASQLTGRTNQFNATTRRRSEQELQAFLRTDRHIGWTVNVCDRFGDYGCVGVLLLECRAQAVFVDTFLLSCRVLGKGVEHQVLAAVGRFAVEKGIQTLEIPFQATKRNAPMEEFLNSLPATSAPLDASTTVFRIQAHKASAVLLESSKRAASAASPGATSETSSKRTSITASSRSISTGDLFAQIALELKTSRQIQQQIEASLRRPRPSLGSRWEAPMSRSERWLASVWMKVLNLDAVGILDHFFELGGSSILAIQVVNQVQRRLGEQVHVAALFEAPTIADLLRWIRDRYPHAASRLDASEQNVPPETSAMELNREAVPETRRYPVSFAQQRLWFLDQLDPGGCVYNVCRSVRLRGPLQSVLLEGAVHGLIRKHAAFRTTFVELDGEAQQQIAAGSNIPFTKLRLDDVPLEQREQQVHDAIILEGQRPFDLSVGPLFRVTLIQLSATDHVLVWVMHHIISDGTSMAVLFRDLSELYAMGLAGKAQELPTPSLHYTDFVTWQRGWFQGNRLREEIEYWRTHLDGAPALVQLPYDRPRPAQQSYRGDILETKIPPKLVDRLKAFSQAERVTLFTTLMATFKVLLLRYSGQEDLVVGTPIANRQREEFQGLVGFFANSLALRTDLSGNPTFRELVQRELETARGAFLHQDLPFERLVEELQPERDLSRTPVFQVMLALLDDPLPQLQLASLEASDVLTGNRSAKFDLFLSLEEGPSGIRGFWEYATDLFDRSTIEQFARHFLTLLEGVVQSPGLRLSELPLLSLAETRMLLFERNLTQRSYPTSERIHDLFERQVAQTPDSVALVFPSEQGGEDLVWSYAELNRRANQLAHLLRESGVGPEVLVGVCLDRTPLLVVSLLAVLKAGGAYVPIDPVYPSQRVAFMLEDSRASVILTQTRYLSSLPPGGLRICLDSDPVMSRLKRGPEENLGQDRRLTLATNLAYVIFTSGSTGRPKGVALEHRNAVTFIHWAHEIFSAEELAGVLFSTSVCFDLSVFELFVTLSRGGKILLVENALSLSQLSPRSDVTLINTVPSAMAELVRLKAVPASVQVVNLAGEPLSRSLVDEIYQLGSVQKVYDLYGPSEDTTYSTFALRRAGGPATIGRPIANTQVYLLDPQRQLVPHGVTGELYLGGAGLARGYLNRPDLTAERFVMNPFRDTPGAYLYRTGDLARYLPDGSLEYLGRLDQQVKVRGFRIELGEIEAELNRHLHVADAVVIAREDTPGDKRIVAYVVSKEPTSPESGAAEDTEGQSEQLRQWETVWEETYRTPHAPADGALNLVGWMSSFTGQPIPAEEMKEWIDASVQRILEESPRRVLEIGCGTGLLLFRLAPSVERYVGMDVSASVITSLRAECQRRGLDLSSVQLHQGSAEDVAKFCTPGEVDLIVLNSVAQYFPSADYFANVIETAMTRLKPGGKLFLGDLRSARHLDCFHAAVQLFQAPSDLSVLELRQRIHQFLSREQEFAVDPHFFATLRRRIPSINRIEVQLKPGAGDNELTRFRYDVILAKAEDGMHPYAAECNLEDWGRRRFSIEELREVLLRERPVTFALSHVPNRRLIGEAKLLEWIASGDVPPTVGPLRERVMKSQESGFAPEQFYQLGKALGYRVQLRWATSGGLGEMEVLFSRGDAAVTRSWFNYPSASGLPKPLSTFANRPLQGVFARRLVPSLKSQLDQRLPDYMVPSAFVLMEAIPRTPNGKLNRKALPPPERAHQDSANAYEAPATPLQEQLSLMWAELLGYERVGIRDDFFELGGHSLLATQLVSRIRTQLGRDLPLRTLFEARTVAALALRLESGGESDASQVAKENTSVPASDLVPVGRDQQIPLSFSQQRLWFLAQYDPSSSTYNISPLFRIRGRLDPVALERALQRVQQRHESLRTAFVSLAGVPVQRIHDPATLTFRKVDLRSVPEPERLSAAEREGERERQIPFDLAQGDCFRATLLQLSETEWHLLITLHHAVCDGWSMGILAKELGEYYREACGGEPSRLPDLPIQYADFAIWQRERMRGELLQTQLQYWKERLRGAPPFLQIPTDRPRPALQTFRGRNYERKLPRRLSEQIKALGRREDVTLFMVTLAVFKILLQRYTGEEDLLVGTPIANRTRKETESLIGFFVNTLVLRTDLGGNPSFCELLKRLRESALGAYEHQDLPFEKLVEELQPERSLSYGPVVQVLFVVQNAPLNPLHLQGCEPSALEYPGGTAKFDLTLFLEEQGDGLLATWEYNTDLFDDSTIARWMRHFETLLSAALSHPESRIQDLPMLPASERQQLLSERNRPRSEYPDSLCVQQLFEIQAEHSPGNTAVVMGPERWSYRQLNERANPLAHRLQDLGVGPDVRVVISIERSIDMVVALLATLKAGGCYVPIDPAYPLERISIMLEEAKPKVILTHQRFKDRFAASDAQTLCLDIWRGVHHLTNPPPAQRNPDRLAYVIFTSGSTGRPKGVAMAHRPLMNLLSWQLQQSKFGERDRTLQFASLSFDVHFQEFFTTWATGGAVVLIPEELRRDPVALLEKIASESVTRIFVPFVAVQQLADAAAERPALSWKLREVITAGEALVVTPQLKAWFKRLPGCVLENQYGPSETHVVTAHRLSGDPESWPALPPIGKPIQNVVAYVLDPVHQPVPVGVPGELFLGGVCLARGYLDRPELTQQRFLQDPFNPSALVYRTGDLVRYRDDGALEFLGRADQQVKIRGFRVELGEIENVLTHHSGVREAVVVAQEWSGSKRLVGFLIPSADALPPATELREFLLQRLPDYMVPALFVSLDKFPLTPSGKINRRTLPLPQGGSREAATEFVAPQGDLEPRIASVWCEVLRLPRVGVHDNFFDLGGHSLLMVTLQSRLNAALDRSIPVLDLFRFPTVASLAKALSSGGTAGVEIGAIEDRVRKQREMLAKRKAARRP